MKFTIQMTEWIGEQKQIQGLNESFYKFCKWTPGQCEVVSFTKLCLSFSNGGNDPLKPGETTGLNFCLKSISLSSCLSPLKVKIYTSSLCASHVLLPGFNVQTHLRTHFPLCECWAVFFVLKYFQPLPRENTDCLPRIHQMQRARTEHRTINRRRLWRKKHFAGVSLSTSAVDPWEIRRSYRLLFNLRLLQHSGGPTTAAVVGALRDTTRVLIRRPVQAQILWSSSIFINPTSISVFPSPPCAL